MVSGALFGGDHPIAAQRVPRRVLSAGGDRAACGSVGHGDGHAVALAAAVDCELQRFTWSEIAAVWGDDEVAERAAHLDLCFVLELPVLGARGRHQVLTVLGGGREGSVG